MYESYFKESANDFQTLAKELEKLITKIFPKSYLRIENEKTTQYLRVHFAFGKDKSEWLYGQKENDMLDFSCSIGSFNQDGNFNNFTAEVNFLYKERNGSLKLSYQGKQDEWIFVPKSGMTRKFFDRKKFPDPKKAIVEYFEKHFTKSKKLIKDNFENLRDSDKELVRKKGL